MSNRSLIVLFAVLLVAAGGFAAWAFVAYRGSQFELAERERFIAESEREKQERREEERREFDRRQQALREMIEREQAEDDAIPLPREKLRLVAIDIEELDVTLPEPGAGGKLDGKGKDPPVPLPDDQQEAKLAKERSSRWVLRFKVADSKEYVEQLKALGAEILIPLPPDNDAKKSILIGDLSKPEHKKPSDADLKRLAGKVQFSDTRKEPVAGVMEVLKVEGKPPAFWAFFPKELEAELARKESNYRNRRAEDIEETIFQVAIRGGKTEIVVADQKAKK